MIDLLFSRFLNSYSTLGFYLESEIQQFILSLQDSSEYSRRS